MSEILNVFHVGCGGELYVTDFGESYADLNFRFEVWCDRCRDADPNGYATREEAVVEGAAYFNEPVAAEVRRTGNDVQEGE